MEIAGDDFSSSNFLFQADNSDHHMKIENERVVLLRGHTRLTEPKNKSHNTNKEQ